MPHRSLSASLAAVCLGTLLACTKDSGGDTGATESTADTEATTPATSGTGSVNATTGDATTHATTHDSTTDAVTSAGPTASTHDATTTASTAAETTDPGTGDTTAPAPTDGPGVLPGETGIDSFCRRYVECGGTYYADSQACLDETFNYWGECPSRRAALDAFGACMSELDCSEWSPDAYNPASTPWRAAMERPPGLARLLSEE